MPPELHAELKTWLARFLNRWDDSGVLYEEAADAILETVLQAYEQKSLLQTPTPEIVLQRLESLNA